MEGRAGPVAETAAAEVPLVVVVALVELAEPVTDIAQQAGA